MKQTTGFVGWWEIARGIATRQPLDEREFIFMCALSRVVTFRSLVTRRTTIGVNYCSYCPDFSKFCG